MTSVKKVGEVAGYDIMTGSEYAPERTPDAYGNYTKVLYQVRLSDRTVSMEEYHTTYEGMMGACIVVTEPGFKPKTLFYYDPLEDGDVFEEDTLLEFFTNTVKTYLENKPPMERNATDLGSLLEKRDDFECPF
jgi:hypothetical protein